MKKTVRLLAALWYLAGKLQAGRQYSEPEINALLDEWTLFQDPARSGGSFITKGFWTGRQTAAATGRKKARLRWKRFWRSISEWCGPVSKYDALWAYLQKSGRPRLVLTFAQIGQIAGVPLDHAFLRCKKELCAYGYAVERISLKAQTVAFVRREEESV